MGKLAGTGNRLLGHVFSRFELLQEGYREEGGGRGGGGGGRGEEEGVGW